MSNVAGTALHDLTSSQALRLIKARKLSSEELVTACLARIEAREPTVAAWSWLDPQRALEQARRCDAAEPAGLLHGVPLGIKDMTDTADMPTAYGSRAWQGHTPARDATCVTLIRNAGGVVLGKTVTPEFGVGAPGSTSNPLDHTRTPGGSSSGSAAAVADRMVPLATGTQTAASVIRPASFCGLVGYKPTTGLLSLDGCKGVAETLDCLGTLARTLEDTRLFRDALLGAAAPSAIPALDGPPRLAFCRSPLWHLADEGARSAVETLVSTLSCQGAAIAELELPAEYAGIPDHFAKIVGFELQRTTAYEWSAAPEALSTAIRDLHKAEQPTSLADYLAAREAVHRLRRAAESLFATADAIITLGVRGEAPVGLGSTGDPSLNVIWQVLGLPALNLPLMTGPAGMPIGLQLVGRPFGDDALFAVARSLLDRLGRSDL